MQAATAFCTAHRVDLTELESLPAGNLDRLTRIAEAVDRLISPDPLRKDFLAHARWVVTLFQAVKPDPAIAAFSPRVGIVKVIADTIRERTSAEPANVSAVMREINELLDKSIAADGFQIRGVPGEPHGRSAIDLSAIDFEALAKRSKNAKRKNVELEQLKAAIRVQLDKLIRVNRTRTDFLAKFEELIESYNAGSRNIDDLFRDLVALTQALSDEQQRHVREQLSEPELTVLDVLTRPGPNLTADERAEVKRVARQLLERVRAAWCWIGGRGRRAAPKSGWSWRTS